MRCSLVATHTSVIEAIPSRHKETMDNAQAIDYIGSFLGKRLRIHTSDTRMFIGDFKCTDNVSSRKHKSSSIAEAA